MANVRVEKNGEVTTVVLCRPERRNAVDRQTADELSAAFAGFDADDRAKVAVFWGEGGSFCAGADLKAVATGDVNRIEPEGDGPMGPTRSLLTKPVIAAINGHAVAGGLELALWCDLRVAEEGSVLGVFCRRWGVPLIDGGTVRLPRLIGLSRAMDLILTGRAVSADEALAMGLVNRVVGPGQARQAAESLARQLCEFPQMCMNADRWSAYHAFDGELPAALLAEFKNGLVTLESESGAGARRFAGGAGRHGSFEG